MPTVIEALREEWGAARTASAIMEADGNEAGALKEIEIFHRRLCTVKVLDPACGSGNFLYVTLECLKRLEGEVMEYIANFPRQLVLDMTGGYSDTGAITWIGSKSPCSRYCRRRALDRILALAFPHAWQCPPFRRPDFKAIRKYQATRCSAELF
jgi:hypothetical protein